MIASVLSPTFKSMDPVILIIYGSVHRETGWVYYAAVQRSLFSSVLGN